MTEWRPVDGFPGYEVSDDGRVRSIEREIRVTNWRGTVFYRRLMGVELKPAIGAGGYPEVHLYRNQRDGGKTCDVHVLVARAFHGPPLTPEHEVRHLDGNQTNCAASNLAWGTGTENNLDAVRHGTHRQTRKTSCPRDHELRPPNLTKAHLARNARDCLACNRARSRAAYYGHDDAWFRAEADKIYAEIMGGEST